jgi:hypothetical protein
MRTRNAWCRMKKEPTMVDGRRKYIAISGQKKPLRR